MRHAKMLCCVAAIAQLGERQTEDLKVPGSIPGHGIFAFAQCQFGIRLVFWIVSPGFRGRNSNDNAELPFMPQTKL